MLSPWLVANLIGFVTLPIAFWQFGLSRNKIEFLMVNFGSCLCWAGSLWMTRQDTAAAVSLCAGTASVFQAMLTSIPRSGGAAIWWRRFGQVAIAALAIGIAVRMAPPAGFWSMLPVAAFVWIRFAETLAEIPMRALSMASPLAWMTIAWHGGNYSLIPVDAIALASGLWWFHRFFRRTRLTPALETSTDKLRDQDARQTSPFRAGKDGAHQLNP